MLKEVYGCTQQLFWFPCLNLFLLRRYQQASASVRQEDKQDQPPSFKSVQPLRTAEDCENNGYSVPLRVEPKVAGGPLGVPQPRDTDQSGPHREGQPLEDRRIGPMEEERRAENWGRMTYLVQHVPSLL